MTEILATTDRGGDLATIKSGELSSNPAAVYLTSLALGSRRAMIGALGVMAGLLSGKSPEDLPKGQAEQLGAALGFPWGSLRYQHTAELRARLAELYAYRTANRMLSALRGVLFQAFQLRLMSAEDYTRAKVVKPVTGDTAAAAAGRALTEGEKAALLRACANDKSPAGARDLAMLGLGIALGYRRAEPIALDVSSYDTATGALMIHGKRNKDRTLYVRNNARRYLENWLTVRGPEPGPMFCPVNKGGRVQLRRMTPQAFYNMLAKRAAEAGIVGITPHDLRRTLAGDLLDAGADLATVAKMLGHSSIQTTAGYDRRGERAKERAAELVHLPYYEWGMLEPPREAKA